MDGHGYAVLSEIGAVLLALGILGRFAGRLGVSPIPLYLLAGLAFGHGGVLALSASSEFISTGAQIGVLLLLLTLGLEYSATSWWQPALQRGGRGRRLVLGAAPGAVAGFVLGWGLPGSLAMAGVTAVSSSGIIAKVIADLGRRANPETPVVVSILVLEDLAMAMYLPGADGGAGWGGCRPGVVTVAVAVGTVSVVLLVATRWSHFVSRAVSHPGPPARRAESSVARARDHAAGGGAGRAVAGLGAVGAFLVGIALVGPVAEVARKVLLRFATCSPPCSSSSSGCRPIRRRYPRCCSRPSCWPCCRRRGRSRRVGGPPPARDRAARAGACRGDADLARRVLHRHRRARGRQRPARAARGPRCVLRAAAGDRRAARGRRAAGWLGGRERLRQAAA